LSPAVDVQADLAARAALAEEQKSLAALSVSSKSKSQVAECVWLIRIETSSGCCTVQAEQRTEWSTVELGKLAKASAPHFHQPQTLCRV
jgi:hypothetical protein